MSGRRAISLLSFFLAAMGADRVVHAQELKPEAMLERCYRHLTGQRLPATSPLRKQAATGADPVKLCLNLLNAVKLAPSGALESSGDATHRRILRQFTDLHLSWFRTRAITSAELTDANTFTVDLYDANEPALFYSRALFAPGAKASAILRGKQGMEALRDPATISDPSNLGRFTRPSRAYFNNAPGSVESPHLDAAVFTVQDFSANPVEFDIPAALIQVGQLYGVRPRAFQAFSPVVFSDPYTTSTRQHKAGDPEGWRVPHDIFQHYGGGALGTQSYLMMNFGHGFAYNANGTTKLPRKWMASALEDFLCLKVPVLRESDVNKFKRTSAGAPDFRKQNSCLRCHATMDQGALAARNIKPTTTSNFTAIAKRTPLTMGAFNADRSPASAQEFWPFLPVTDFHRQPTEGLVLFRSSKGDLIEKKVSDLEGIGQALSSSDDFYNCAAKRYVKYFTGVDVELYDEGDPANAGLNESLTDTDREFKKFVKGLGANLKTHQSLRELVKAIMTSSFYRKADFGRRAGVRGEGR